MIGQLMREQARAHRASLAWTASLLTLAVALAGYAAFSAAQQDAIERYVGEVYGVEAPWTRSVTIDGALGEPSMSKADLDAALDAADAEGAETAAVHPLWGAVEVRGLIEDEQWGAIGVAGVRGAVDWDALLLSGSAPGPGEVVLGEGWHSRGSYEIGDEVAVEGGEIVVDGEWTPTALGSLTVSGFMREGAEGRYGVTPFDALIDWDDSFAFWGAWRDAQQAVSTDTWSTQVQVGAQVITPALDQVVGEQTWLGWLTAEADHTAVSQVLALTAAVLAVGMIGTAFAVGRAQAQGRSRWVATARVLGARRSHIVVAAVLEVLVLGLVAGLVGVLLAWGGVAVEYASFAAAHPDALLPSGMEVPLSVMFGVGALALVMAIILGAIPAFWASRVTPAAALKPVTPVTEAQLSRDVSRRWPYGLGAGLFLLTAVLAWPVDLSTARAAATWLAALCAAVAMVGLLVQAVRDLVGASGRRLARARRPWALAAGDALAGGARGAAIPGAVVAIGMAALVGALAWSVLAERAAMPPWEVGNPSLPHALDYRVDSRLMVIAMLGGAALVLAGLAAFVSASRATSDEDHARRALGLSLAQARGAAAVRFAVPLLTGLVLGVATGLAAVLLTFHGVQADQSVSIDFSGEVTSAGVGPLWAMAHASHLLIPVGLVTGAVAATVLAATAVAALSTVRAGLHSMTPSR